jgi:ribosomal-protein-alanine N-acetyltransferase
MYVVDLTQNALATFLVMRPDARSAPVAGGSMAPGLLPPVLAYGGFWLLLDEAHVATIASHPEWRGCGLAQWLMLALLDVAMARGAVRSTLEVRISNLPAQRLYDKLGYQVVGARPRYYRDGEDGLIMTTPDLTEPAMQERLATLRNDTLARLRDRFGGTSGA